MWRILPTSGIRTLGLAPFALVAAFGTLGFSQAITTVVTPAAPTYADSVAGLVTIPGQPTASGTVIYSVDGGTSKTAPVANGKAHLKLGRFAVGLHVLSASYSGSIAAIEPVHFSVMDQGFAFVGVNGHFYTSYADSNFSSSTALAVDTKDTVYVADSISNQIALFDIFGTVTTLPIKTLPLPISHPSGLAFDAAGNLYISDYGNARVVKYTPAGVETLVNIPGIGKPGQLVLDKTNNLLYIVDQDNNRVARYDLTGGTVSSLFGGATKIDSIALDATGGVYLSDNLLKFDYSGSGNGAAQVAIANSLPIGEAGGIFVDRAGQVYASDQSTNNIWRIDTQGNQTQISDEQNAVYGAAEDSRGRLYLIGGGPNIRTFIPFGFLNNTYLTDGSDAFNSMIYTMPSGQTSLTGTAAPAASFVAKNDSTCDSYSVGTCYYQLLFNSALPGTVVGNTVASLADGTSIPTVLYGVAEGPAPALSPGTQTQSAAGTATASGVAVDQLGNYFATDSARNAVVETSTGTTSTLAFSGLSAPTAPAVDGFGAVYVLDRGNNRIAKLDAAHNQTSPVVAGAGNALSAISSFAIDGGGQIYFAGPSANGTSVYLFDRTGATSLVTAGLGATVSLALDPYGDIYLLQADGSLVSIDINNKQTMLAPASTFANPIGLAVDPSKTTYITKSGVAAVTLLHPDGSTISIPVPALTNPAGLSIDGRGDVLAVDSVTNQFTYVDRTHQDFNFGNVTINTQQTFVAYFSNSGTESFRITGVPGTSDFMQVTTADACDGSAATTTIAAGSACNLSYTVAPTTLGHIGASGRLTTTDSIDFDNFSETVVAGATPPAISPASIAFGNVALGTTSTAMMSTVTNTSSTAFAFTPSLSDSTDFKETDTCNGVVAANATCVFSFTFTPQSAAALNSTFTVTGTASPSTTLTVALSGTGTGAPALTITPGAFAFGTVAPNANPVTQTLVLKNTGNAPDNALTFNFSESDQGAQTPSLTYGAPCTSLAAGATCNIVITFTPHAGVTATGTLTVNGDAGVTPAVATITGTGAAAASATLSTTSFNFGSVSDNTTTPATTFTLSNTGGSSLTVSSLTISGAGAGAAAFAIVPGSNCTTAFAANAACTFQVSFSPTAVTSYAATVTVADQAGTQTLALSGMGTAVLLPTLTPASLNFGIVEDGGQSAPQILTLTNPGNSAIVVGSFGEAGDYSSYFPFTTTCGTSLAAGASCTVSVSFAPTIIKGTVTASIADGVGSLGAGNGTTVSAALTGTAIAAPIPTLTPASLNFGNVQDGAQSAPQILTLTNTATVAINVGFGGVAPQYFPFTTTCGSSLAAGASCTVSVSFAPTIVQGTVTASIVGGVGSLSTGYSGSVSAAVTGTAIAPPLATLTPASLNFSNVLQGTKSAPQILTLTNPSQAAVIVGGFQESGGASQSFPFTTTCGINLAAGASCTVAVSFAPSAMDGGTFTASIVNGVTYPATAGAITVSAALTGIATAQPPAVFTPASLDFGNVAQGTQSAPQILTLTNPATIAVRVSPLFETGLQVFPFTTTCGTTLAAGASCTVSVSFAPSDRLGITDSISVDVGANDDIVSASVTGAGIAPISDFKIAASPASATGPAGTSFVYTLTLTPILGPFFQPITLSASGLPAGATAVFYSQTVTPGTSSAISFLHINTAAASAGNIQRPFWPLTAPISAGVLLLFPWVRRRRMLTSRLGVLILMGISLSVMGCGVTSTSNATGGTPSTITVTATSGSFVHTTTVTLSIQ